MSAAHIEFMIMISLKPPHSVSSILIFRFMVNLRKRDAATHDTATMSDAEDNTLVHTSSDRAWFTRDQNIELGDVVASTYVDPEPRATETTPVQTTEYMYMAGPDPRQS